jgi:hypothetical protein
MMRLMPQKYPRAKARRLIVLHAGTRSEGYHNVKTEDTDGVPKF